MNRAQLRLELLRIVHHTHQAHTLTLEIVEHYEKAFDADNLIEPEGKGAEAPATPTTPRTPRVK